MDNDASHNQRSFQELKEAHQHTNTKLDQVVDTLKEIQHDMPKRKSEQ